MTNHDPSTAADPDFADLGLPAHLLETLRELGYEAPSPIQSQTIPALLSGRDLVGQAQTGTGKTAAFALPVLARLDPAGPKPAALVLAPTRELAIQVAEAFHRYASHQPGFHVLPIYGGQAYGPQLAGLRRGADVVVGTPGRVIDHLNKGTLKLDNLATLVLDEADEMLRMGFIDDVERVLELMPDQAQIALFSATMPSQIRRIAQKYLKSPIEVTIRSKTTTAATIRQRYWMVSGMHKLDALTRILEVEPFDAMIVFARTRVATEELASRLSARGFSAAALNGDVPQNQREQMVEKLKNGEIDILVATDVAARGLDVERISHVINYDIPYDTEAYVHRIGPTRGPRREADDSDKRTYRIEVGHVHRVKPGNIVGAIANEGSLDAAAIGRVRIQQNFSLVDLPANLDSSVLDHLAGVRVAGQGGPGRHKKASAGQGESRWRPGKRAFVLLNPPFRGRDVHPNVA